MALYVYRSSAGSGKTTALVNAYLKIALQNPSSFKHILAITFTNKAAAEMKERILAALKQISDGAVNEESEYAELFQDLNISKGLLISRANQLMELILHNYDDFSISTIDSFVHRIIRTFATDLRLPQNFEVVIDQEDFVPDIIAELFEKVGNDEALTNIMVNFVLSQTEEEKGRNIKHTLNNFVNRQIGEEGFLHLKAIEHLSTSDFVEIITKLSKKRANVTSLIKKTAGNALEIININGLGIDDFYFKKNGIYGFFVRCKDFITDKSLDANSNVLKTIHDGKWTAGKPDASILNTIDAIKTDLIEAFNLIQKSKEKYFRLKLIYKRIYVLALAHEIRSVFLDYTDRTQKVHISEFNKRISNEIANQPVPFIYERLGRKYRYFLIDEFQDTSVLQWQNLLPLIEESLGYDHYNMLVGDAKQAIYRFRNGEVELFVNLPKLYNNDGTPEMVNRESLLKAHYIEVPLDKNWRSENNIIQFNNAFFEVILADEASHIKNIYKGHVQKVPANKEDTKGLVSIDFIETDTNSKYIQLQLEKIKSQVELLLKIGYKLADICVLTRTNSSAIEISSFLLENNYNVVSSESLLLTNSPKVRLIIAFYKLLLNPNERIFLAEFIGNLVLIENYKGDFNDTFLKASAGINKGLDTVCKLLSLPIQSNEVYELSVYEIAEYVVQTLELSKKPSIYLHYFFDFVFEAQAIGKTALNNFIDHWENNKSRLYISMPDGGDAVKVMTVHKAKGLKFNAVITDLTKRTFRNNKTDHWMPLNEPGLEELSIGILPIVKDLNKIGLEDIYEKEQEKTKLDYINLVYVACTRAVSALFLTGHISDGTPGDFLTGYLIKYLENKGLYNETKQEYQIGELQSKIYKAGDTQETAFSLKGLSSSSWKEQIKVAGSDKFYWEILESKPAREYGNLVHTILSKIKYTDDVEKVIDTYSYAGIIDETESLEIKALLNSLVMHPELSQYFKKDLLIKNETDVFDFDKDNGIRLERPDRVVLKDNQLVILDYKTGLKEPKHWEQVEKYRQTLSKLGYSEIICKLVYLSDTIEVVTV